MHHFGLERFEIESLPHKAAPSVSATADCDAARTNWATGIFLSAVCGLMVIVLAIPKGEGPSQSSEDQVHDLVAQREAVGSCMGLASLLLVFGVVALGLFHSVVSGAARRRSFTPCNISWAS
jgi:hypothetical protein